MRCLNYLRHGFYQMKNYEKIFRFIFDCIEPSSSSTPCFCPEYEHSCQVQSIAEQQHESHF